MRKFYINIIVIVIVSVTAISCTPYSPKDDVDAFKEVMIMLGTDDAIHLRTKSEFIVLRNRHPSKMAYLSCLESNITLDNISITLRKEYESLLPEDFFEDLYAMLNTKTGEKYLTILRAGPPFDTARSNFTAKERIEIEEFSKKFQHLFNQGAAIEMQKASVSAEKKLMMDAKEQCAHLG